MNNIKHKHTWKYKKEVRKASGLSGTFDEIFEEYYCQKCLLSKRIKKAEWHPLI